MAPARDMACGWLQRGMGWQSVVSIASGGWVVVVAPSSVSRRLRPVPWSQGKRTKKAGVVGKYGTRYGATLRKVVKKYEISQHAKYQCTFCGKVRLHPRTFQRPAVAPVELKKKGGRRLSGRAKSVNVSVLMVVTNTVRP